MGDKIKIDFKDEHPDEDFATVYLQVPSLQIHKPLIGKAKPKNAEIETNFLAGSVEVKVKVTDKDGKVTVHEYKRDLPEDINPDKTHCQVDGKHASTVLLHLCKASRGSWVEHDKYFIGD